MLKIKYVKQPDNHSCALACYTMIAMHFFQDTTFDQIAKISDWQPGYTIWAFKFWLWIMDKRIRIKEYDTFDYQSWAKHGFEGLRKSLPEKEFNYYIENSKDLDSYTDDIKKVLKHPNFTLINTKPTFKILEEAVRDNKICEVVLDSRSLRDKEGFALHRVVILDINDKQVIFHDPAKEANSEVSREKFINSWLVAISEPELCIYEN